jgi:hypothetical protein
MGGTKGTWNFVSLLYPKIKAIQTCKFLKKAFWKMHYIGVYLWIFLLSEYFFVVLCAFRRKCVVCPGGILLYTCSQFLGNGKTVALNAHTCNKLAQEMCLLIAPWMYAFRICAGTPVILTDVFFSYSMQLPVSSNSGHNCGSVCISEERDYVQF